MEKFDISCGLTKKQIDITKYGVKNEIERSLPILPDAVETILFLQGSDAWTYKWGLTEKNDKLPVDQISLEVIVKLKKEFHDFL